MKRNIRKTKQIYSAPKKIINTVGRYLGQSFRMMVGIPDYPTYLDHMARKHPDKLPMSYEDFFKERQEARYNSSSSRCC